MCKRAVCHSRAASLKLKYKETLMRKRLFEKTALKLKNLIQLEEDYNQKDVM